jgi:hypothetical protein
MNHSIAFKKMFLVPGSNHITQNFSDPMAERFLPVNWSKKIKCGWE